MLYWPVLSGSAAAALSPSSETPRSELGQLELVWNTSAVLGAVSALLATQQSGLDNHTCWSDGGEDIAESEIVDKDEEEVEIKMMEGGRLVAVLVLLFLMSDTGVHLFCQLTGWVAPPPPRQQEVEATSGDKKQVLTTITSHCLPKLVCQLYALENTESISESERNLIALIG